MKKITLVLVCVLCLFSGAITSHAATAVLTWDAPTMNTDGTPVTDLAGYNVYRKLGATGTFIKLASTVTTTYTDTFLVANNTTVTWCYGVTAFDTAATPNESAYSNEVCKSFIGADTIAPKTPANLKVQ